MYTSVSPIITATQTPNNVSEISVSMVIAAIFVLVGLALIGAGLVTFFIHRAQRF